MTTVLAAMTNEDGSITQGWGIALIIIFALLALAALILFIAALISVLASTTLTTGGKVVWVLVVFAFPFIGSLLWFLWGRNATLSRSPQQ